MSEFLRDTLKDLAIVIFVLAILVALGGYILYKYSYLIKDSLLSPATPQPKEQNFKPLELLEYLRNTETSLEQLTRAVILFLNHFDKEQISLDECALILQLAIRHKNIKGNLVLQLERCFKQHFKEESQLFEFLVMDGLKNR